MRGHNHRISDGFLRNLRKIEMQSRYGWAQARCHVQSSIVLANVLALEGQCHRQTTNLFHVHGLISIPADRRHPAPA